MYIIFLIAVQFIKFDNMLNKILKKAGFLYIKDVTKFHICDLKIRKSFRKFRKRKKITNTVRTRDLLWHNNNNNNVCVCVCVQSAILC